MSSFINKKYSTSARPSQEAGFTILEMTAVVIISGIILAFLGAALLGFMKEARIETTEYRIERIEQALARHLSVYARYPCPASQRLGPSSNVAGDTFATEVSSVCNAGGYTGTTLNAGVRIGAVPTRSLNLPDEYIADAWGKKFTYAVTANLATNLQYTADGGRVRLRGETGAPFVTNAHYVIVSHGETGTGAHPLSAATNPAIPCPAAGREAENCDNDRDFRITLVNNDSDTNLFFDDYVYYKGIDKTQGMPAGAVMAFNEVSCPDGWLDFVKARGKFIIGAQETPLTRDLYTLIDRTTATINIGLNNNGQDVRGNIPTYHALRYCEKLPY